MKNLTNYLLAAALLASPALLVQAAEQQLAQAAEPQEGVEKSEQRPQESQPGLPRRATPPEQEGGGPADMASEQPSAAGGSEFIAHESGQQILASNLIGYSVTNLQNENIGQVEDLILNQDMRSVGMVISTGGFLGLGAKHVALPMSEVQINRTNKVVQVHMSKEEFNKAPPFKAQKTEQNGRKEEGGAPGGGMGGQ